jgi:hypothetical protein
MLFYEFLCLFIAIVLLLVEIFLIIKPVMKSPIIEMKIFFIGMVICVIGFSSYLLVAYYSNAYQVMNQDIAFFDKIGYFLSMFGLLLIGYAFILPNFELSYLNIFLICLISGLGISSAFVNGITSTVSVKGEFLSANHNIFGLILNYLFIINILYVITRRIYEISKISKNYSKEHKSNKFLSILLILFSLSFLVSVSTNFLFPNQILPSNFYYLFISLAYSFFIFSYLKDKAFFFLTPISLDAIIITHKKSGVTIYSESYKENFRVEDMLSSVFSLLNISLQEFIIAKQELEEIAFADKMVIIVPGNWISSILIVSKKNLIVGTLAKALTTKFENQFIKELSENTENKIFNKNKFLNFKEYTSEVRSYLPL